MSTTRSMTQPRGVSHGRWSGRAHAAQAALLPLAAVLLLLGGCASLPPDGGLGPVRQAVQAHLGHAPAWPRNDEERHAVAARVQALLAAPLSVDGAVEIALVNHRGLQASFGTLGVAQADLLAASRPPNPGLSFGRLARGGEVEFERSLHVNLARWLAWPLVQDVESQRLRRVRLQVTQEVLALAAQVRKAYVNAVAASQTAHYRRQANEAARAGAELAERMARAGNWSALRQAREHSLHAETALALARAEQAELAARETLVRLLGLGGQEVALQLPDRLPDLPAAPRALSLAEQSAMDERLDVRIARLEAAQLARNLALVKRTRFIHVLELGAAHNSSNEAPTQRGYEISFELPLFDGGTARTAQAEALYRQALDRAAQTAAEARSEVRQAHALYRSSFEVARHYRDEVVPLKKRISDEMLLRYNGMFISVFDLLADARAQMEAVTGYIQAQRDFWIARADLEMALVGKPALTAWPPAPRPEVAPGGPPDH